MSSEVAGSDQWKAGIVVMKDKTRSRLERSMMNYEYKSFYLRSKSIHDPVCVCLSVVYLSPVLGLDLASRLYNSLGPNPSVFVQTNFFPS